MRPPEFSLYQACSTKSLSDLQHHCHSSPRLQANSHSASVGRRQPIHIAKSLASYHVTLTLGCVLSSTWILDCKDHLLKRASVTTNRPMLKSRSVTLCLGGWPQ